jgi:hypothetical protein
MGSGTSGNQWRDRLRLVHRLFADPLWLSLFTLMLAVVAGLQTCILNSSDKALSKAADAAKDANSLNSTVTRPWLAIEPKIIGTLITNSASMKINIRMTVDFVLRNTGRAPAIYATIIADLTVNQDPLFDKKRGCENVKRSQIGYNPRMLHVVVLPGETLPAIRRLLSIEDYPLVSLNPKDGSITPIIFGCVDYGFVGDSTHHQTGFAYDVSRKSGAIGVGAGIPADDLELRIHEGGGFYAD